MYMAKLRRMTENITFKIKRSCKVDHVSKHGAIERDQFTFPLDRYQWTAL